MALLNASKHRLSLPGPKTTTSPKTANTGTDPELDPKPFQFLLCYRCIIISLYCLLTYKHNIFQISSHCVQEYFKWIALASRSCEVYLRSCHIFNPSSYLLWRIRWVQVKITFFWLCYIYFLPNSVILPNIGEAKTFILWYKFYLNYWWTTRALLCSYQALLHECSQVPYIYLCPEEITSLFSGIGLVSLFDKWRHAISNYDIAPK